MTGNMQSVCQYQVIGARLVNWSSQTSPPATMHKICAAVACIHSASAWTYLYVVCCCAHAVAAILSALY